MNRYKSGFTLVGMLIVLIMLGFFFTLTIPVIKSANKNIDDNLPNPDLKQVSYQTLSQKAYQEISQALVALPMEYNCNDLQCTGLFDKGTTSQTIGDALSKHLGIIKNCGLATDAGCFSNSVTDNYDGTKKWNVDGIKDAYRMVTNTGAALFIYNNADNCTTITNNMPVCGYIYVDVNGKQFPNEFGKDIFYFYITNTAGSFISPENGIKNHSGI